MADNTQAAMLERLKAIAQAIEPERLYDTILAALGEALDAQSGVLWVGEKELAVAAVRGLPAGGRQVGALRPDAAQQALITEGQAFPWPPGESPRTGLRIPLIHRGKLLGLLELSDRFDGRTFDARDRETIALYAPFCAIALSNAAALQTIKRRSLKDPETDTYNLLYFVDYAGKEIYKARRYGRKFSLLLIKIDNLQVIRQTLTPEKAKEMLRTFVEVIRGALRDADTVAKVADDELWLLLPETDYLGGRLLAQKMFRAVSRDRRLAEYDKDHPVLLAIGTASFPRDGDDFDALLARCRARLEDFRQSLWRKQHLGDLAFWDLVSLFVAEEALYAKLETAMILPRALAITEDRRGRSRHVILDSDTWARVQTEAVDELARNPDVRGVLFAGVGTLSESHEVLVAAPRAAGSLAPIYLLGRQPRSGPIRIDATNVTAVPSDDAEVAAHQLLLLLTEVSSYAFVGRRSESGRVYGYHTADPVLVESLVAKLQDQYYLQGRF